jgi:CopG-like RHH_1 or ribbon-helix-helix domain, RHH_5
MAKKQASTAKLKRVQVKVPKRLYRALKKEAKKQDVAVSELALAISERGIRKRKEIQSVITSGLRFG